MGEVARQNGIDTEAIRAEAKAFAEQEGIRLIETSAKHNSEVDTAFFSIASDLKNQAVPRRKKQTVNIDDPDRPRSIFARLCKLLDPKRRRRNARKQRNSFTIQ